MTTVRISPSGPPVPVSNTTSDLANTSTVPGATASDALDSLLSRITEIEDGVLVDQFFGGVNASASTADSGLFGDRRWSFFSTGGSVARSSDHENYIGAYTVTSTAGNTGGIVLSSAAVLTASTSFFASNIRRLLLMGTPDTADSAGAFGAYRYGFGSDPLVASYGDDGIFFEVDRAINDSWRVVVRSGGLLVASVETDITFTPHDLTTLELIIVDTVWRFSIDGVVVASLAASIMPTARLTLGLHVEATADSAQSASLDECEFAYRRTVF